jgi:hypothetical protein
MVPGLVKAAGEEPGEAPFVLHHQYVHAAQFITPLSAFIRFSSSVAYARTAR